MDSKMEVDTSDPDKWKEYQFRFRVLDINGLVNVLNAAIEHKHKITTFRVIDNQMLFFVNTITDDVNPNNDIIEYYIATSKAVLMLGVNHKYLFAYVGEVQSVCK